ncbi:hypothetical protein J6590_008870 [Homalodisca vitripennis]|nr:hypothetical protein J6590_008870 [Homalodisca vitripennis]
MEPAEAEGWRTVVLERGPDGLGFSIVGGHQSPYGDLPIYVKTVFAAGVAAGGGLRHGDQILAVDGLSMQGLTHQQAVAVLKRAQGTDRYKIECTVRCLRKNLDFVVTGAPVSVLGCHVSVSASLELERTL